MFIGVLHVQLYISTSGSLKSKRQVIKSLKDRLRANFNVSVSETAEHEKWQKALISIACIGKDKKYINGILSRAGDLINTYSAAELIDMKMEIW
ncbi:MAG: DUF503 domain-containing protein [Candidatus Omnitrophota bacterium]